MAAPIETAWALEATLMAWLLLLWAAATASEARTGVPPHPAAIAASRRRVASVPAWVALAEATADVAVYSVIVTPTENADVSIASCGCDRPSSE